MEQMEGSRLSPPNALDLVIPSRDVLSSDGARFGGKAIGLLRLEKMGLQVPSWMGVSSDAFVDHLRVAGVSAAAEEIGRRVAFGGDNVQELAGEVRSGIQRTALSERFFLELAQALTLIPGPYGYALRSSALDEDGRRFSFAGIHETFLAIRDHGELCRAVINCWSATVSDAALAYRRCFAIKGEQRMA